MSQNGDSESDIAEVPVLEADEFSDGTPDEVAREPSDGIDLMENEDEDYRSLAEDENNNYNLEGLIDESDYEVTMGHIEAANAEMDERDRLERMAKEEEEEQKNVPPYLIDLQRRLEATHNAMLTGGVERASARRILQRTKRLLENPSEMSSESATELGKVTYEHVDLKAIGNPNKELLELDNIQYMIALRFREFLFNYSPKYVAKINKAGPEREDDEEEGGESHASGAGKKIKSVEAAGDGDEATYMRLIEDVVANQSMYVPIDLQDLLRFDRALLLLLVEHPHSVLPVLDQVTESVVLETFPNYLRIFNPRLRRPLFGTDGLSLMDPKDVYDEDQEDRRVLKRAGHSTIRVCPYNLPYVDGIRSIRFSSINHLVQVRGVVTRRTAAIPVVTLAYFKCQRCSAIQGPIVSAGIVHRAISTNLMSGAGLELDNEATNSSAGIIRPRRCPICGARNSMIEDDGSAGAGSGASRSLYENYQRITVQETPSDVPPGRIPSTIQVIIAGPNNNNDISSLGGGGTGNYGYRYGVCHVDCCKPGDEVEVVGIYTNSFDATSLAGVSGSTSFTGTPLFSTCIEAKAVRKVGGGVLGALGDSVSSSTSLGTKLSASLSSNDVDARMIRDFVNQYTRADAPMSVGSAANGQRTLYNSPLLTRVIRSFAPTIYGHEDVKMCLLLSLVGGVRKNYGDTGVADRFGFGGGDMGAGMDAGGRYGGGLSAGGLGRSAVANLYHRVRGDINTLIVGDPSTSKSQMLLYAYSLCSRGVYTSGKGASGVGLTATVKYNGGGGGGGFGALSDGAATLDAGALVLSDNGCCFIDEFDKMSSDGISSIHEAMEQQTISVAKGGIVASMNARCAVVAACNPCNSVGSMAYGGGGSGYSSVSQGKYDSTKSLIGNVSFSDTVLSRFDLIVVVKDTPEFDKDKRLAEAVVREHMKMAGLEDEEEEEEEEEEAETETEQYQDQETSDEENMHKSGDSTDDNEGETGGEDTLSHTAAKSAKGTRAINSKAADLSVDSEEVLPHSFLKEYIRLAKAYTPVIKCDLSKIMQLYTELRQLGNKSSSRTSSILTPIGVRTIQSIVRIAEGIAKLHLRSVVLESDLDIAIAIAVELIISQQRNVDKRMVSRALERYVRCGRQRDIDVLEMVMGGLVREQLQYELAVNDGLTDKDITSVAVSRAMFESKARDKGIMNCSLFYESPLFVEGNYTFDATRMQIIKQLS